MRAQPPTGHCASSALLHEVDDGLMTLPRKGRGSHVGCAVPTAEAQPGTAMPRTTAGRAPIASYQRFTLGNSPSSTVCHSWRAAQG